MASRDWHRVVYPAVIATARLSRSCLIFESKRMPRARYTGFDVLQPVTCIDVGISTDMSNRVPPRRWWQIIASVRALLTTALPLLTLRTAPCRVRITTARWNFLDPLRTRSAR